MQCRICGGELNSWLRMPIDAKKDRPTPFQKLSRCERCAVGMVSPLPRPDQIAEHYRLPAYYTHGRSHMRDVKPGFWDKVLTKLAWKVDRPSPFEPEEVIRQLPEARSVCDLGCGHGEILQRFRELDCEIIGVEPDPESREKAVDAGVPVLPGTAESLPGELAERQFDLVVMTHSLEHCIDPVAALRNAYRLTKEGGYLYCEVPNCGSLHFETLTVCAETFDSPRHLWFFTAKSLRHAIESTGYQLARWHFAGFTRHHSPSWRAWEKTIFDQLAKRGEAAEAVRHTFWKSLSILARSAFAPASRKYDCVGLLARKQAA